MKPDFEAPGIRLYCGDARVVLASLPDESVQCCVASPPYGALRAYGGFTFDFEPIAQELFRVLCDGGILCWNVADECVDGSESLTSFKQAIYFKEVCGFRAHDTMIYHKHSFSHPEAVRYHSVFEYVFILSKGAPRCFHPIKDKPNATAGRPALGLNTFSRPDGSRHVRVTQGGVSEDFGMRGNVWKGKTRGQEEMCKAKAHPAMMPKWLARDLILSWSNPGDVILDPFSGSGTVPQQAIETARSAIAIDINPEYCQLTKDACNVTPGLPLVTPPMNPPVTQPEPQLFP